jgi:hypothetical protein
MASIRMDGLTRLDHFHEQILRKPAHAVASRAKKLGASRAAGQARTCPTIKAPIFDVAFEPEEKFDQSALLEIVPKIELPLSA